MEAARVFAPSPAYVALNKVPGPQENGWRGNDGAEGELETPREGKRSKRGRWAKRQNKEDVEGLRSGWRLGGRGAEGGAPELGNKKKRGSLVRLSEKLMTGVRMYRASSSARALQPKSKQRKARPQALNRTGNGTLESCCRGLGKAEGSP